ncbi:polysaccharide biosynthesis tyrosine autokinase [Pseudoxanthomonas winnipegensis]|uniref:polysaccharide biosynthesis tyrosine autokinase n=1 Tax=Pseudoxanthomonas winnipegensis TaxID=2480810 RepID=UPI00102D8957|nr:polysaccharide biosynthesis tyrosine autokinase [Pseudoxanthomonas winnipegensis]TAA44269.1 polysaccharide biosynthesis tyrosine autokinase [Pseudoxanthomonas winnipegensis]
MRPTTPPAADSPEEDEVNLLLLLRNVSTHRRLFLLVAGGVFALALVYLLSAQPTYRAQALLQIDEDQGSMLGALSDVAGALNLNKSIDGELDILTSRTVMGEAIDRTQAQLDIEPRHRIPVVGRLYARLATPPNGLADPLLGLSELPWGGERLRLAHFEVPRALYGKPFVLTAGEDDAWTLSAPDGEEIARGRLGQRVDFNVATRFGPGRGSIQVEELRARSGVSFGVTASSLQTAFEEMGRRVKATETSKDSSMIELTVSGSDAERTADFANALARAYVALNIRHRAQQAHLSLQFLEHRLPALRAELTRAEDALNAYRMRSGTIDVEQQSEALLARVVELTRQQTLLELNREASAQQFRPTHPAMRMLEAQHAAVAEALTQADAQIRALPAAQQEYLRLARDVAVDTQLYTALAANKLQLEVAEAGTTGTAAIIDPALSPERRHWPTTLPVLAGGLMGGLLLGFLAVQVLAGMRRALHDPLEVERLSGAPVYAVVPESKVQSRMTRVRGGSEDPLYHALLSRQSPTDPGVEALRTLRSTFRLALREAGRTAVVFTGPTEGVGKTFVTANFAYLLALTGVRVLLVDGDLRRAGLGRYFPDSVAAPGLSDVLAGQDTLEAAIQHTDQEGLDLLPSGRHRVSNPGELLARPTLDVVLREAEQRYDYVIVDSPPVLPVGDAMTLARACGAVFIVSRYELTNGRQLVQTLKRLTQVEAKICGHVFNGLRASRYGDGYGYGYGYGTYGADPKR